jgi:hypothetical protein
MRSIIRVSTTVLLACVLQCCQPADKANFEFAASPGPVAGVITPQSDPIMRLRSGARAYVEHLNQGRCETGRERTEFDRAISGAEATLAFPRSAETGSLGGDRGQASAEAEQAVAQVRLDVADAARNGGCSDIADVHYKAIVRDFRGPAFTQFRNRAEIGLSAMQL